MLSVCIPVFNYDVCELVNDIHKQCKNSDICFEIIISDDVSTDTLKTEKNKTIELPCTEYIVQQKNIGNALNRNFLAQKAKYDWLLFIDADMQTVDSLYIKRYLNAIKENNADVFSGGILYKKEASQKEHTLKLLHGRKYEAIKNNFNKDSFLGFTAANFLIKKEVFTNFPISNLKNKYGYLDTIYGIQLKLNGYNLKLTNNPLYHNGLETANQFISKTEKALENAYFLQKTEPEVAQYLKIIKFYKKIKPFKIVPIVRFAFGLTKNKIRKNLTGNSPSLFLFQLYKLGYFCSVKSE